MFGRRVQVSHEVHRVWHATSPGYNLPFNMESGATLKQARQHWNAGDYPGEPVPVEEVPSRQSSFELEPASGVRVRRFALVDGPHYGLVIGQSWLLEGVGGHEQDQGSWWTTQRRVPILHVAIETGSKPWVVRVVHMDAKEMTWQTSLGLLPSSATG